MNRVLPWILALELMTAVCLSGWRCTRPAPPTPNLSRLAPTTRDAIHRLQQSVWSDRPSAWQELGEAYLAFGYFAEAELCLNRAARQAPQYASLYAWASSLERMGRLSDANEQFAAAAATSSGSHAADCQFRIGRNCLRMDDVSGAEAAFARAPLSSAANCERARLLIRTGRAAESLPLIAGLREMHELDVRTEMLAVQAYRELNRPRELWEAAERAERARERISLSDHWQRLTPIRTKYGLAASLSRIQQLSESAHHRQAAAEFDLLFKSASWDFMEQFVATGVQLDLLARHPAAALAKLDAMAERKDLPPSAKHLKGQALAAMGHTDAARKTWIDANALQPAAETWSALATVFAHEGDGSAARDASAASHVQAGIDAFYNNDLSGAVKEFETVRLQRAHDTRLLYYLGRSYAAIGREDAAREVFEGCLSEDREHGFAKYALEQLHGTGSREKVSGISNPK